MIEYFYTSATYSSNASIQWVQQFGHHWFQKLNDGPWLNQTTGEWDLWNMWRCGR